jgi:hypothetical protein
MQNDMRDQRDEQIATTTRPPAEGTPYLFTCEEWVALLLLRRRYRYGQDLWDASELARLSFLRWLYVTGRSEP